MKPVTGDILRLPGDSNKYRVIAVGNKYVRIVNTENELEVKVVPVREVLKPPKL